MLVDMQLLWKWLVSITTIKLTDNLKKNLLDNNNCPFWNN